jgi:hypothetical protein
LPIHIVHVALANNNTKIHLLGLAPTGWLASPDNGA